MVVINQNSSLNFGKNNSPEISINRNLKRWFSRNIGLWKSNRTYFFEGKNKTPSKILLLPEPLGPVTTVKPSSSGIDIDPPKDLK